METEESQVQGQPQLETLTQQKGGAGKDGSAEKSAAVPEDPSSVPSTHGCCMTDYNLSSRRFNALS